MGSGLILLVIVAAWLAVLVPMALRSHESSTSLDSVDRFSDAMRVLSRRDAAARARARLEADDDPLSAQAWAQNQAADEGWDPSWDDDPERPGWRERLGSWRERVTRLTGRLATREHSVRGRSGRPCSPAARRRRLLLTLVLLTVLCAAGGTAGPPVLLAVAGVLGVAVALVVVQLRRLAVARARRAAPARSAPRPAPERRPEPAPSTSVRVQPVDVHPVASPAVRHDEPLPAAEPVRPPAPAAPAAALGAAWSPVPVPPPTYVTAPVAPARAPRTVDLTRPGAWSQQQDARAAEELPGSAAATPPAAERRRAVNEW